MSLLRFLKQLIFTEVFSTKQIERYIRYSSRVCSEKIILSWGRNDKLNQKRDELSTPIVLSLPKH